MRGLCANQYAGHSQPVCVATLAEARVNLGPGSSRLDDGFPRCHHLLPISLPPLRTASCTRKRRHWTYGVDHAPHALSLALLRRGRGRNSSPAAKRPLSVTGGRNPASTIWLTAGPGQKHVQSSWAIMRAARSAPLCSTASKCEGLRSASTIASAIVSGVEVANSIRCPAR
jgi:hypothetical protein